MTVSVLLRERARQALKGPVRRVVRRAGFELVPRSEDEGVTLLEMMKARSIDLLLDVGANQGQYAEHLRASGYAGDIVSFEPGQRAFRRLEQRAAADSRWEVRKTAVGAERSHTTLNVSANSVSSSLLPVAERHVEAAASSVTVAHETVDVIRLDEALEVAGRAIMLKVDTQGFELPVLEGLGTLLDQIQMMQLELSLVELYKGQATYLEVLNEVHDMGFVPCLVLPGFTDPQTHEMLQVDVVACRGHRAL